MYVIARALVRATLPTVLCAVHTAGAWAQEASADEVYDLVQVDGRAVPHLLPGGACERSVASGRLVRDTLRNRFTISRRLQTVCEQGEEQVDDRYIGTYIENGSEALFVPCCPVRSVFSGRDRGDRIDIHLPDGRYTFRRRTAEFSVQSASSAEASSKLDANPPPLPGCRGG